MKSMLYTKQENKNRVHWYLQTNHLFLQPLLTAARKPQTVSDKQSPAQQKPSSNFLVLSLCSTAKHEARYADELTH